MKLYLKSLLIYFCSALCFIQPAFAGDPSVEQSREFERIALQVQAQKTIELISEELRTQGVNHFSVTTPNGGLDEDMLAEHLKSVADQFFANDPEGLARSKKVIWKKVAHWMSDQVSGVLQEMRTEARLYGVDVGITYLIGAVGDKLLPIIFAVLAQPELAATVLVLPTGVMETAGYLGLKNLFLHHKIVKEYGGRESYRAYQKLELDARKKLHLQGKKDVILPLSAPDAEHNSLVISNDGLIRDLLNLIIPRTNELTFHELKQISLKNGMTRKKLRSLKREVDDKVARESMLFEWLQTNLSEQDFETLKTKYPASFINVKSSPELNPISIWAGEAVDVKSCEDLTTLAKKAPMGVSVPVLMSVWQNVMMPKIADDFQGLHISRFYRMSKSSFKLQIIGRLAIQAAWNDQWQSQFMTMVDELCK